MSPLCWLGRAAALALGLVGAATAIPCHFARSFSCKDFFGNDTAVESFLSAVMAAEGSGFAVPGVGYEPVTGFTYDGHPLNYTDGTLTSVPHPFSAPSKESLHVGMLALAVSGNSLAQVFVGGVGAAVELLSTKMGSYEAFNSSFPGYGCFLPWVAVNASGIVPNSDWVGRVPGLDNGEWAWSMFAAAQALQGAGYNALASRYNAWFTCMAANAKTIFYMGDGNVSSVVLIANMSGPVIPSNYNRNTGGVLNDPYEGETLTVILDLFSEWENSSEREQLWLKKRPLLQAVNYTNSAGRTITVQRGWWFSAHEQWKTMMLPYLDVPLVRTIFANCERVRTWDALDNAIPGLFASVNDVTDGSIVIPDYISAAGIASVAFSEVERRDVITPYGAWPLMLHNVSVGLCWYSNMLSAPRMQGVHGSTEAVAVNGTEISPLTTWDSKITTVLAMAGGISPLVKACLQALPDRSSNATAYERFVSVQLREYSLAFPVVVGDDVDYAVPNNSVPRVLSDWTTCSD